MPRKRVGQLGFADALVRDRRSGVRDRLSEISGLLDWSPFGDLLSGVHNARRGEASYPPLVMFKVVLLQRWYGLSDPGMEEALSDRLSFRRFAGLSLSDETPDHSTIWRFREALRQQGLLAPLLAELSRQLEAQSVVLKQGTLIDATLVTSAARRPRMREGKTSKVDPDARFGANNERRRYEFGYKLHIAVDGGSGLVRGLEVTPANVQDVTVAADLVQGDEAAVYADRAYDARALHDALAGQGIADGVMRRNQRHRKLTPQEIARNHLLSARRRPVEKVFGTLKRSYRLNRMPYFNQARNTVALTLACFAYNLRRWHAISTA